MTTEKPDYLTENPDFSITVTLSRPYEINGVTHKTITLREPTAGYQKSYMSDSGTMSGKQAADIEVKYLAGLSGEFAPDDLDALKLRDYRRLQVAFSFFLD